MLTNRMAIPFAPQSAARWLPLLLVCASLGWSAGCFTRKASAFHNTPAALAHPIVPAPMSMEPLEPPPNLALEIAKPPRLVVTPRSAPPRPHVASAAPVEPAPVEKSADPIIVPDLSPEDQDAARNEAQHSLDVAEANLAQAQGKQLSAAQADVVSKVRSFMENSREAMKNSDWLRAKNLAKKAEVLSRELLAKG